MQAEGKVAEVDKIYSLDDIPIVDAAGYLEGADDATVACQQVADSLHKFGICILRDPRVVMKDNDDFIDIMEQYFD